MEEIKNLKSQLRKHLILQRDSLSGEEINKAEEQLTQNFLNNETLMKLIKKSKSPIAIYYPSKNELSPIKLAKNLFEKHGIKFCLPVVTNKNEELKFVEWNLQEEELQISKIYKNILEPNTSTIGEAQHSQYIIPETLLVPLVAFNQKCTRLGMGGGFYDKTIFNLRKQNQQITTIGIAYEMQKLPQIPTEENDVTLDFVITENSIYKKE